MMKFHQAAITFLVWSARQNPSRAFASSPLLSSSFWKKTTSRAFITTKRTQQQQQRSSYSSCSTLLLQSRFRGGAFFGRRSMTGTSSATTATTTTAMNSAVVEEEETTTTTPVEIFRQDYRPLPYTISTIRLEFDIYKGKTIVTTEMQLTVNPKSVDSSGDEKNDDDDGPQPLVLDGDETSMKLQSIQLDGVDLKLDQDYTLSPDKLILLKPKDGSWLKTKVEIIPEDNTQLSGLYKASDCYCTQCEAVGFRRITYFPDRPDNMSTYESVKLIADATDCPVLLSNGNLVEKGIIDNNNNKDDDNNGNRHYAIWSDPFPKPSYLFAAVAGNLKSIQDSYTTTSGRSVQLEIFSEPNAVDKLEYAMDSLKRSMKWDEDRFGLEYDLGIYNIVATSDFNMGAMENKGLNIFNTAYVLADQKTATDVDFERVEGVIGHEVRVFSVYVCVSLLSCHWGECPILSRCLFTCLFDRHD